MKFNKNKSKIRTVPRHATNNLFLRFLANYIFSPLYSFFLQLCLKWGTTYQVLDWHIKDEVLDRLGSDYDENGIPYWEKTGFIDPDEYNRRDGEIHSIIEKEINGSFN